MKMLCKLVIMSGVAIAAATFPAMAQQGQQQMPMGQGGMMGPSGTGMMNQGTTTGQGMMGGYPMMMGGYPMMMGPMMGGMMPMMGGMMPMMGGMMPMMGGMMPMMGGMMPMMGGYPMGGMMGPAMMGGGVSQATNLNLSVADVTGYLQRWLTMTGNPRIKVGSVTEKDANTITADIVTTDKDALVQRFNVDRHTGLYTSVQ